MSKNVVHRASEIGESTGRTLMGFAYRYERPALVTDDGRTKYFEEILRGADRKSLTEGTTWRLDRQHDRNVVLGEVTFHHSDDEAALLFEATLNRSEAAEDVLADLGSWGDVSVSYVPLRNAERRTTAHGRIVQRAELRLDGLALAATGSGQVGGAEVLAVRAHDLGTPRLDALRKRLVLL